MKYLGRTPAIFFVIALAGFWIARVYNRSQYYIYSSSERRDVAIIIDKTDGSFFEQIKFWRIFIIKEEPVINSTVRYDAESASLFQLNFAIPKVSKSINSWSVGNIHCVVRQRRVNSRSFTCTNAGGNASVVQYTIGKGVQDFSADCALERGKCLYSLIGHRGIDYDDLKRWSRYQE